MPRIEINKVAEVLKKNALEPKQLRQIIEELNQLTQSEAEEENPPAIKKQFVILVSDPEKNLPKKIDFAGWVIQIPEAESVVTTQDRIFRAVYDYNASKKGRLYPAKTVGEAIENIPSKFFKDQDLWLKTKIPVLVLRTDNSVPKE
jgi:hypothetical protein